MSSMSHDNDQHRTNHGSRTRATVHEAAISLDVTVDAIRKRIQRGTIPHERHEDGRVYVLLDEARTMQDVAGHSSGRVRDNDQDANQENRDELVEELRGHVEHLRSIIGTRDEELRRKDHIMAALAARIPEVEAPASPEARNGRETAADERSSPEPPETSADAQTATQRRSERRSWWRRLFDF